MYKKFERKILHFDGDSFFASVEQVLDYRLRGKPLVTGGERGAITSASVEAKRLGINRGLTMKVAKEMCPELIVVPGNYLAYSIFAERMYAIVREFTENVEEYSIDECFADISGLDKRYKKSYEEIGELIKEKLESSLGLTFGVGLAPTKVLAKVASKHRKPAGFTMIDEKNVNEFLQTLPIGKVWGIGPAMSLTLNNLGVKTASEFVEKPQRWLEAHKIAKPYQEIWLELQGVSVMDLNLVPDAPKSIIKSRTFRPPTSEKSFVFSQLSKNVEAACLKARNYRLAPRTIRFYLKTQEFRYHGHDFALPSPTSSPVEIMRHIKKFFDSVYRPRTVYRATGISLSGLTRHISNPDLFGESREIDKQKDLYKALDKVTRRFGEGSIHLGSSLKALKHADAHPEKTLDIPILGKAR